MTPPLWLARLSGVLLFMLLACSCNAGAQQGTKSSLGVRVVAVPIRDYVRFTPPARYEELMREAIACSGAVGNIPAFADIVWLQAPGVSFPAPPHIDDRLPLNGLWQGGGGPPDTIVIGSAWMGTDWLVKHELIHYVLQLGHLPSRAADDSLWGIACQARRGFLPPDTTPSKPGTTTYYQPAEAR